MSSPYVPLGSYAGWGTVPSPVMPVNSVIWAREGVLSRRSDLGIENMEILPPEPPMLKLFVPRYTPFLSSPRVSKSAKPSLKPVAATKPAALKPAAGLAAFDTAMNAILELPALFALVVLISDTKKRFDPGSYITRGSPRLLLPVTWPGEIPALVQRLMSDCAPVRETPDLLKTSYPPFTTS